ncbi:ATP-binding protein [Streptomyces sp. B1866]|uniref:ATP-binding protein n=1 Tax=Streptomyces sp. B1866 TaxID=3075431 RepID=UPI002891442C|nr:ATP-binding protein [Streptomyces sp. B1866]MDT3395358.1 ATP-binding protein [Streptomyces sp. B1866]
MEVHQIRLPVSGTPAAAVSARRQLTDVLRVWNTFGPELLDRAELVAAELIANAVLHAGDGPIWVGARLSDDGLRIEVTDAGSVLPRVGLPDTEAVSGRGLFLVAALADRHGFDPTPSGKRCWAEFAIDASLSPAQNIPSQRS